VKNTERLTTEQYAWVAARLALGWTFLWAFLDKAFGLGYATESESAWINGGSPTTGFLTYATSGPLSGFYEDLAGNGAVDAVFMAALLLLGVALILGVADRIAGYGGALLMLMMWTARLPPENNPVIDEHIVYLIVLLGISAVLPGKWLGLGEWWSRQGIVKRFPILRSV
jgi:thiosulfate dehydrogenase [quinone] large subunit